MLELLNKKCFWELIFGELKEVNPKVFAKKDLSVKISKSSIQITSNKHNHKFDTNSLPVYVQILHDKLHQLNSLGYHRVAIAGGSGLIGRFLTKAFKTIGWETVVISRSRDKGVFSDYSSTLEVNLNDFDIVFNLCGTSVLKLALKPWKLKEIRDSRIKPTKFLASVTPSHVLLINASAIGKYNAEGEVYENTQNSTENEITRLVSEWEAASLAHPNSVQLRFANVISRDSPLILYSKIFNFLPLKIFVSSKAIFNWLAVEDILDGIFEILNRGIRGPINMYSGSVDWISFQRTLLPALGIKLFIPEKVIKFINPILSDLIFTRFTVRSMYYVKNTNLSKYLEIIQCK